MSRISLKAGLNSCEKARRHSPSSYNGYAREGTTVLPRHRTGHKKCRKCHFSALAYVNAVQMKRYGSTETIKLRFIEAKLRLFGDMLAYLSLHRQVRNEKKRKAAVIASRCFLPSFYRPKRTSKVSRLFMPPYLDTAQLTVSPLYSYTHWNPVNSSKFLIGSPLWMPCSALDSSL